MAEENKAGLEQKVYSYEEILGPFIGGEVIITFLNSEVVGVLNKPNYELGYFDVKPSIVAEGDGKRVYVEREKPIRISLSSFDTKYSIRPLKDGYTEKKAEAINAQADKEKRRIGL